MPFENIIGLYALGALIILIILYLRRPRPRDQVIPSLMFFIKQRGTQKKYQFFRRLLRNLILILQILTIVALAFALAEPYIHIPREVAVRDTVLVIDTSASSQVKSGISSRFEDGIKEAKKNLKGSVSIIAASQIPTVILEKGSKTKATSLLQALEPTDTPTNIEAAMYEAEGILKEEKGNIVVISDFITIQDNDQPLKANRILSSKGNVVKFIDTSNKASNIGIINLDISKNVFKAYVKNYNEKKQKVTIKLLQNGNVVNKYTEDILPDSVEIFKFSTPQGVSKLELDVNDDFTVDNYAYISTPERKKITTVLITNLKEGEAPDRISRRDYLEHDYLTKALKSSPDIDLHIIKPPRMTITTMGKRIEDLRPEVIITHKLNKDDLIKHAFIEYSRLVDNGSSFIITAQDDLEIIDFENLLPIKIGSSSPDKTKVCIDIFNYFTKRFQEIRCFTNSRKYYKSIALNSTVVIASADDKSPMIALKEKDDGKLVYYGIFDDYSDFKLDEDYPIFWDNLISFLIKEEDIREYNKKFEDEAVLGINKVGVYEKESDVSSDSEITSQEKDFISESEKALVAMQLAIYLLATALVLMFIEIIYVKFRGDA